MKYDKFKCEACEQTICEIYTTEPVHISSGTRVPEKCPWGEKSEWRQI